MLASALSSEFCTVQVQEGLSSLQNSEVSAFGSILKCCINSASIRTASSEVAAIGMCPLREI